MATRFVLLLLPAFVLAYITVYLEGELKVDEKYPNTELTLSETKVKGIDYISPLTDTEINTFNVSENNLINAAYSSVKPKKVYFTSPTTPGDDLYELYNLQPVNRMLMATGFQILNVSSELAIVHHQVLRNNYVIPTTFTVNTSTEVQNKVSSTWSTGGKELTVAMDTYYFLKVKFVNCSSEVAFYYKSPWGQSYKHLQNKTLVANVDVVLDPGQSLVSQITATKHNIKFAVKYTALLGGSFILVYGREYYGPHVRDFNFRSAMGRGGIIGAFISREVIDFEFYSDFKINFYDQKNATVMTNILTQAVHWYNDRIYIKPLNKE